MKTRTEKSLLDVFYGQPLQKSPDFENAKEEPGNSKKLGLTVRTSARIQAARDRLAQHTRASQARIQASSPFTPEQQRKVAAAMDMFEQERNQQIRAAHQQFSGEQLEQAMRMIHAMHDEKSKKFLATMTAPTPLPAPKGEEPMERSLLDVFYGRRLRKAEERPSLPPERARETPKKSNWFFGHHADGSRIIPEWLHDDRLADHPDFDDSLYDFPGVEMEPAERNYHEDNREMHYQIQPWITAAKKRREKNLEDERRALAYHENSIEQNPEPSDEEFDEKMELSLFDVFYGRRLRKAEERPPEEDDDLPGPDEDDYAYEEPSEEEMEGDPNWEHGYHPDGSRIIPERMHQDSEAPKPESFPRNVSVEEEDHGDREDPSLESVRQMISPRLKENRGNHDPYIWPSLDRDARGKRYKKSESFAEQKEVFQKSVPFPMQMKYGPISPVRKFAK